MLIISIFFNVLFIILLIICKTKILRKNMFEKAMYYVYIKQNEIIETQNKKIKEYEIHGIKK